MDLIIVESPSKAKTISKYLKGKYRVDASGGHVCDLPEKRLGVDIEHNFEPTYTITPEKKAVIKRLEGEVAKADNVYLATDPDREGEAISWHLQNVLKLKEGKNRIEFNEISPAAVTNALKNPREINYNLVDAQQARRVLDRLVGYKLSPLLCKRIRSGLSAGRVQSADRRQRARNPGVRAGRILEYQCGIAGQVQGVFSVQGAARRTGGQKIQALR